jgi:hypothetical protein
MQMSFGGQALPQAPQWLRSSLSDTHSEPDMPGQTVPAHVALQAPATQNWPAKHAFPHVPQLAVLCKLTHCPPQNPSPAPHASWHAPAWQTAPGAHATPHAPQC